MWTWEEEDLSAVLSGAASPSQLPFNKPPYPYFRRNRVVEGAGYSIRRRTTEPQLFELRRSRRIAGLPPTPTAMAESEGHAFSTTQRSVPAAPRYHYMEPRPFAGRAGEDVDAWLTQYKRVSRYNCWDATDQLGNVALFLTETALMWYENHEDSLTTWDRFTEELKKCFGDSDSKKKSAERTLAQRAQTPGETCTTYIEEVLMLCKIIDPYMTEEDMVGHLLKGIAEDVYNFLIGREDLTSVSAVQRHCRTFEKLKTRRIAPKFGRLANVTTVASVNVSPPADLAATIRAIVREELQPQDIPVDDTIHHPPTCSSYYPAPFAPLPPSVCVTDVREARASWPRRDSFASDQRYDQRLRPGPAPQRRAAPVQQSAPPRSVRRPYTAQRSQQWFGERPLPICYNCGVEGHIARYCNYRQPPRYDCPPRSHLSDFAQAPTFPGSASYETPRPLRNRSPASDRSLTPPPAPRSNRSPSPRRRYPSPPPEN